jgi:poly-gamma-glutamate synthesis protein (capsule biosynthesis protein)
MALVGVGLAMGLLVACGSSELPDSLTAAAPDTTAPPTTAPGATAAPTTTTIPPGPVTFAFGGDVHFEGVLRGQLAEDPAGTLAPIAPTLSAADIAVVNLETAITERGTAADKAYTFRAPATAFTALSSAGVDVVSMANNHAVDFGDEGLADTIYTAATTPFPVIGIGQNAAGAFAPYTQTVNGQRVAIFGATQVLDANLIDAWTATDSQPGLANAQDPDQLVDAVTAARPDVDTLVVFLHWGTEGETCPQGRQTGIADQLIAAGADIVVGSHAHRLQGAGMDGEALVAYGLGNFAFYSADGSPGADTGVLMVTATGRTIDAYEWVPATIRSGVPHLLEGEEAATAVQEWDGLRECAGLAP